MGLCDDYHGEFYPLRCCVCGAVIGNAADPYQDPSCMACEARHDEALAAADREAGDRLDASPDARARFWESLGDNAAEYEAWLDHQEAR